MGKRGLIVGKFYPPHRGHKHLIDTARAQVDDLAVIVCRKLFRDEDEIQTRSLTPTRLSFRKSW